MDIVRKEAIQEAATIEEAKEAAARELGLSVEEAEYEILQQPQKKTLGLFGGAPARVRAYRKETAASAAAAYLEQILRQMGVADVTIDVKEEETGCVLTLNGEDLGFIIGRRGDTLDALQYLTGLVANRVDNTYYRVTIDVGNYREKREQALVGLAKKVAGQAARTGRRTSLEPMNPYERRIIHTAVQEIKGATSWSVGSDPNRHVIVGPSEDNPVKEQRPAKSGKNGRPGRGPRPDQGTGERRSGGQRSDVAPERPPRAVREFVPRSNPLPTADGATPPAKTPSEKEEGAVLYGRIDL